jgi:nucleoside-diphosphate-sugar epimerase
MHRILITGATGFVGRALCENLGQYFEVVPAVRRQRVSGQIEVGEIDDTTDWRIALAGCDGVLHTAAKVHQMQDGSMHSTSGYFRVNTQGTISLARQAADAGVKRFVFLSSIKAMGENGHFTQESPCVPLDAYGKSKREAELGLLDVAKETGMECVILRLPLVYGPGVGANFLRLVRLVDRGLPLPFGMVNNARSLLGRHNLVDAIRTCLEHPAAADRTYLLSDGEDVSTAGLIRKIAAALGKKPRLLSVSPTLMRLAATGFGKRAVIDRLLDSLVVDSSAIRTELGWSPPSRMQDELVCTATWYKSSLGQQRHSTRGGK